MATLVLTAVGSALGGPIGSAIGAALGAGIDQRLFSPKGARGARLGSLAVQGSSYGADLPRVFGTMRLAGTVIWATDLREERHRTSTGKGRPKATSYSYSASFAVALSARAVRRVGRIWADGNLLRGQAGDWKSDVGAFRLHAGGEDQAIDPLIAAAEGLEATPAYRGMAYAVFEDLQLADFGNRLPSLSFELVADEAPVPFATIAAGLSDGAITGAGAGGPALAGYAAGGDSVRGAIEGLARALPVALAADGAALRLVDEAAAATTLADLGASTDGTPAPRLTIDRRAAGTLNEALTIGYYDPARDLQVGSQTARRGSAARRAGAIDLPAAIDAAGARAIAEARLAREWAGREQVRVTVPWRWLACAPGTIVTLPGLAGRWRVTRRGYEAAAVTLEAVRLAGGGGIAAPADPGRPTIQPDLVQGATQLAALDLPALAEGTDAATLLIAAAGATPGWRRATVIGSVDGGATWDTIGDVVAETAMGQADTILPDGQALLVDAAASVEVTLLHDAMALHGDDRLGWSAGAGLVLIGDELVQCGRVEALGTARYRLSRLLRGRRGTEWAMPLHRAGERVIALDPAAMLGWTVPAGAVGAPVRLAGIGRGDAVPAEAALLFGGVARLPPAPVALRIVRDGEGVTIAWTRRSRAGWTWSDGGDVPLGEEREAYRLVVSGSAAATTIETAAPSATLTAAALAGLGPGPFRAALCQIGTYGASREAAIGFA